MTLTYAEVWWLILGLAALTALVKAAGPVVLGGRTLPAWSTSVIVLSELVAPRVLPMLARDAAPAPRAPGYR